MLTMLAKPQPWYPGVNPSERQGLVGAWAFNEGAGTRVRDVSPGGEDLIFTNMDAAAAWVGSATGNVVLFDGSDDYTFGDLTGLITLSEPWTLIVRGRYLTGPGSSADGFLGFVSSDLSSQFMSISTVAGAGGNKFKISTAGETPGEGTSNLILGQRYHLALTWDGIDLQAFIDGVSEYSVTPVSNNWQTCTIVLCGQKSNTAGGQLHSEIDMGLLYNYRLPNEQILASAFDPYAPFREPDLTALWGSVTGVPAPEEFSTRRYPRGMMRGVMRGVA